MPRFYFNIITAGGPLIDFEGTELADLEDARAEAIADARALGAGLRQRILPPYPR